MKEEEFREKYKRVLKRWRGHEGEGLSREQYINLVDNLLDDLERFAMPERWR